MANVRIDANGMPKGPAFECSTPAVHRSGVTAVDASDPVSASSGVDTAGYQLCRFDVALTGVGITNLEVQVLFWNARQSKWFAGASRTFSAAGQYALAAESRGEVIFLKVIAFSGTSFNLSADYVLS